MQGQAFVVTGGGTGIGRAIAARLVTDGATVTIVGRRDNVLAATAAELDAIDGPGRAFAAPADATDEDAMRAVIGAAIERAGGNGLAGAVANAGGSGQLRALHEIDAADFLDVLNLNVVGTFNLLKFVVPSMIERGGGSFVAISSGASPQTHRFFGAYTAAKAAVDTLMRNAADEYGHHNVRMNSVRPGLTMSEKIAGLVPEAGPIRASYVDNTPMAGVGEVDDVAQLVRFLLGGEARWITGEAIAVDGGNHLRTGPDISTIVPL